MLMMTRQAQSAGGSLLVGADVVGDLLGVSTRTVYRWAATGRLPKPVTTPGGVSMWRRRDVQLWVDEGCSISRYRRAKRGG